MTVLSRGEWQARAEDHRARVDAELADVIHRRDRGLRHPVDDFLFHYYNLRPSHLAQWHPGIGVTLTDALEWAGRRFYTVDDGRALLDRYSFLAQRGKTARTARTLLKASDGATARFGCFGMHEWAMVYRLEPGETRHPYLPLRYPPEQIAEVVEEIGCRCTHFDAFRFFTPQAKPLNQVWLSRETQADQDQPGCLHVNMDLYKWAGKLSPAVPSELLLECFQLAREVRVVDMRASAYDLTGWGYDPIPVETAAGRADYVARQRDFAARAAGLRGRLLVVLGSLLS